MNDIKINNGISSYFKDFKEENSVNFKLNSIQNSIKPEVKSSKKYNCDACKELVQINLNCICKKCFQLLCDKCRESRICYQVHVKIDDNKGKRINQNHIIDKSDIKNEVRKFKKVFKFDANSIAEEKIEELIEEKAAVTFKDLLDQISNGKI